MGQWVWVTSHRVEEMEAVGVGSGTVDGGNRTMWGVGQWVLECCMKGAAGEGSAAVDVVNAAVGVGAGVGNGALVVGNGAVVVGYGAVGVENGAVGVRAEV